DDTEELRAALARKVQLYSKLAGADEVSRLQYEASHNLRQIVQDTLEEIVARPRQQVAEAAETIVRIVTEGGDLKQATIAKLERAFASRASFSCGATDERLEKVREARQRLGKPQALNENRDAALSLANCLRTVVVAAEEVSASAQADTYARHILIRSS